MVELRPSYESESAEIEFASDVVRCLVRLSEDGPADGSLSVPFALSAWMRRYDVGIGETIDTVLSLRTSLLSASGLDISCEPVPLRVADPVKFVLNLAVYLEGLLGRAAAELGVSRGEAADAAVELLRST